MSRAEFSKPTKRAALARSTGLCEAVGAWYGLPEGQRCNLSLAHGVQFDHIDLDANSKDSSLANCAAVCIKCHAYKTTHVDVPKAAKTVRQQDGANGIKRAKAKMPQRPKEPKPERDKLPLPPRKSVYEIAEPVPTTAVKGIASRAGTGSASHFSEEDQKHDRESD